MNRAKVPQDSKILVELGSKYPTEVAYDPFIPFEILWVITNGQVHRKFLWIAIRKSGIYVADGTPFNFHTSYHADGRFHWKSKKYKQILNNKPPLPNIPEPIIIQTATTSITDDSLDFFGLANFEDRLVDKILYLDNRMLPEWIYYDVWAVPPFRHGDVPLHTNNPAHIHIITHTNPWIEVIIYEQGKRK
ncbi:MAG: hypothetical protein ACLP2P_15880 [Desulfobaccales bacterium]